jgi:hypothetical protein
MQSLNEKQIAIYEDARNMANIAVWGVQLQISRLKKSENEIEEFVMQQVIDFHFLIIILSRLNLAAEMVSKIYDLKIAIKKFNESVPDLKAIRNVLEHIDEYRISQGRNKKVPICSFQTICFGNDGVQWAGFEIKFDEAMRASEELFSLIQNPQN